MRRLLLLAPALTLVAGVAIAAAPPVQTISLYSYGYKPGTIALTAGQEVTLKFVNTSGKGHDFTAPDFFAHSKIVSGDVKEGEVDLKGGETKTVTLVPSAGEYKVHCGHPFHSTFGMHTTIVQLLEFTPTPGADPGLHPTNLRERGFNHLALRVDDLGAAAEHLQTHGVTMLSEELDYISRKLRLFEGPEGITLELVQWVGD